jgi:hypothetical protein
VYFYLKVASYQPRYNQVKDKNYFKSGKDFFDERKENFPCESALHKTDPELSKIFVTGLRFIKTKLPHRIRLSDEGGIF